MSDLTVVFFRETGFYQIEFLPPAEFGRTMAQQAADHAELNPGTIKIQDMAGTVLWRPQ